MKWLKLLVICYLFFGFLNDISPTFSFFNLPGNHLIKSRTQKPQFEAVDLTLVGFVNHADGLARIGLSIADCLKEDLRINHVSVQKNNLADVPPSMTQIIDNPNKNPGFVSLLYMVLQMGSSIPADFVPDESRIKIAYSMTESTKIPSKWVEIINSKFDAVVVPDEWLREVYSVSGVKKPIFVLPILLELENFLENPLKKKPSKCFRFGCSAPFYERKNQALLVDAFIEEFGRDEEVELCLLGRFSDQEYLEILKRKIHTNGVKNIRIIEKSVPQNQLIDFFKSLDCYVLVSKGEGFSNTPRESLALGIPTILANHTAHKVICDSTFVRSIPAPYREKAVYDTGYEFGDCGDFCNCSIKDVCEALRDVYVNYQIYLEKAEKGREWVKRYTKQGLKDYYLSLIKPKKIILGNDNVIGRDFLLTNSEALYNKYKSFLPG